MGGSRDLLRLLLVVVVELAGLGAAGLRDLRVLRVPGYGLLDARHGRSVLAPRGLGHGPLGEGFLDCWAG